jgi:hypothetical protein
MMTQELPGPFPAVFVLSYILSVFKFFNFTSLYLSF